FEVVLVRSVTEIVHPPPAVDLLRKDGAGLRPADVPTSAVRRQDYSVTIPVDEIRRRRKTELRALFDRVVSGVGHVVGPGDRNQPRIFYAALILVRRLGREHGLRATL